MRARGAARAGERSGSTTAPVAAVASHSNGPDGRSARMEAGCGPTADGPTIGPVCGRPTTVRRRRTKVRIALEHTHATRPHTRHVHALTTARAPHARAQTSGGGHRPTPPPLPLRPAPLLVGRRRGGRSCRCGRSRIGATVSTCMDMVEVVRRGTCVLCMYGTIYACIRVLDPE